MDCWRCCTTKQLRRIRHREKSRKFLHAKMASYFLAIYDIAVCVALMITIVKSVEADSPCHVFKNPAWLTVLCDRENLHTRFKYDYSIVRFASFALMAVSGFRLVGVFALVLGVCTKRPSRIKPFIFVQSVFTVTVVSTAVTFAAYGLPLLLIVPLLALITAVDVYCMPLIWFYYKNYKRNSSNTGPNAPASYSISGNYEVGYRLARCNTI